MMHEDDGAMQDVPQLENEQVIVNPGVGSNLAFNGLDRRMKKAKDILEDFLGRLCLSFRKDIGVKSE